MELDAGAPFEARPRQRPTRAGDVHGEASGRKRLNERRHVTRDTPVPGLRRKQEPTV